MQLVSVLNEWLGYISRIIDYIKIIWCIFNLWISSFVWCYK